MRNKYFLQRNVVPKTPDVDTDVTQQLNGMDYVERMKARYKQFAQRESVAETEEVSVVIPTGSGQHLRKLPPLVFQDQRLLERTPVAVVAVVMGLVTFLVHGYRLSAAPDVFSDEFQYLVVGTNVARGIGLIVDNSPFGFHPPAYFLVEAAYIKLAGLTNTDMLTALFSVRYLNVFFSAITASILLLFGRKLHSFKAGLIMAALFLMDPYVQRINRRDMLETFAMLCVLLGLYIFFTHRQRLRNWQWLGAGIAFGVAVLTKEPMFLPLLALLGVVAWTRRTQLTDAVRVVAIACLLYLSYPLWEIAIGQGPLYFEYKHYEVGEVVSSITGIIKYCPSKICTNQNAIYAPKRVSPENLQILLGQYGTSYLLIALAGIFTIILFLRFRHIMEARYLCAWSIFSFGFGILFGRISDQYFYYLIVPVVLVSGYCLAILFGSAQYRRWWRIVLLLFICLLYIYNSSLWVIKYGFGSDDSYAKILAYAKAHIPPGEAIDLSDDAGYLLLSSTYPIHYDRGISSIIANHDHYFIMSSKDEWFGYNTTTPEFYDWVVRNSQPLLVEQDTSFWTVGLYYLKEPAVKPPPIPPSSLSVTMSRSYLGTLYDIPTGLKTNISLTNVRQQQWNISGYFGEIGGIPANRFFSGIPENGTFTGTINAAKQIQFTVTSSTGQATFSFQGGMQADGGIAGTYCSLEVSTAKCSGYGLWSIVPAPHDVGARPAGSSYLTQRAAQQLLTSTDNLDIWTGRRPSPHE